MAPPPKTAGPGPSSTLPSPSDGAGALVGELPDEARVGSEEDEHLRQDRLALLGGRSEHQQQQRLEEGHKVAAHHQPADVALQELLEATQRGVEAGGARRRVAVLEARVPRAVGFGEEDGLESRLEGEGVARLPAFVFVRYPFDVGIKVGKESERG